MKQRTYNPYTYSKDESLNHRFWNQFHMDFYTSVCLRPKKPHIVPMQAIDWDHIANMEVEICDRVIDACEEFGIKELMGFRYDWNTEIIAQFHASFYFSNSDSTMHWTINRVHFAVDIVTFAHLLGLRSKDLQRDKIHNEQQLSVIGMKDLYRNPSKADGGTKGLKSFFYILNNLFCATLTPKGGDATQIHSFARNLLMRFAKDGRPFNVTNFMWEELIEAENDSRK